MKAVSKRIISFLLSLIIVVSATYSVTAFAYEEEPITADRSVEELPEEADSENSEVDEFTEETEETEEETQFIESEEISENTPVKGTFALKASKSVSADFSALEKAYSKANECILELNAKAAIYSLTSMQALVSVLSDERIPEYLGTEDISGFTESDEEAANELAQSITSAYEALEKASKGCDLSAYLIAADTINNLDLDAYNETKSLGSATRIGNILVKTTKVNYTDALDSENTSTVSCFKGTATQQNIDDATRTILDALYVSVKVYTIITSGAVVDASFQNGTSTGETTPYTATYGSTVIAYSDIDDTAWYLDFSSDSTSRTRQFQGYGSSFRAKVFGNMNIYAETRSNETQNMIRIHRTYDNISGKSSIQVMAFADSSYVLPTPKACPNYTFSGYIVNNDRKNPLSAGDTIAVTGDMDIEAFYTFNGDAEYAVNATALENGKGFSDCAAYNEKIELIGGDNAYAWVEEVSAGKFRPFAIGSDITFLVSESITLRAVTQEEFDSYSFKLPTINMRKSGTITEGTKVVFNGQIVDPNDKVREYGVLIGVAKNGYELDKSELTAENAGNHENYNILRAKSTRNVGANQFAIGVNSLAGKDFIYRGYVIYEKTNGEFVTVYSA
ncbi:MAG: hypothetical protein IJR70_03020 [Eubacterium sp.]|nr:hypothetical protein [Eubacterium sp.]